MFCGVCVCVCLCVCVFVCVYVCVTCVNCGSLNGVCVTGRARLLLRRLVLVSGTQPGFVYTHTQTHTHKHRYHQEEAAVPDNYLNS